MSKGVCVCVCVCVCFRVCVTQHLTQTHAKKHAQQINTRENQTNTHTHTHTAHRWWWMMKENNKGGKEAARYECLTHNKSISASFVSPSFFNFAHNNQPEIQINQIRKKITCVCISLLENNNWSPYFLISFPAVIYSYPCDPLTGYLKKKKREKL